MPAPGQQPRATLPALDEPCHYAKAHQDESNCGGKPNYSRRAWTGPEPGMYCCEAHWLILTDDILYGNSSEFYNQGTDP